MRSALAATLMSSILVVIASAAEPGEAGHHRLTQWEARGRSAATAMARQLVVEPELPAVRREPTLSEERDGVVVAAFGHQFQLAHGIGQRHPADGLALPRHHLAVLPRVGGVRG